MNLILMTLLQKCHVPLFVNFHSENKADWNFRKIGSVQGCLHWKYPTLSNTLQMTECRQNWTSLATFGWEQTSLYPSSLSILKREVWLGKVLPFCQFAVDNAFEEDVHRRLFSEDQNFLPNQDPLWWFGQCPVMSDSLMISIISKGWWFTPPWTCTDIGL